MEMVHRIFYFSIFFQKQDIQQYEKSFSFSSFRNLSKRNDFFKPDKLGTGVLTVSQRYSLVTHLDENVQWQVQNKEQ